MLRDLKYPRRLKRDHVTFRLVLTRRIPDRAQAAIYRSMPIFSKGKLVEDYLVIGPGGVVLGEAQSLSDALTKMFLAQGSLRKRRARPKPEAQNQPKGKTGTTGPLLQALSPQNDPMKLKNIRP